MIRVGGTEQDGKVVVEMVELRKERKRSVDATFRTRCAEPTPTHLTLRLDNFKNIVELSRDHFVVLVPVMRDEKKMRNDQLVVRKSSKPRLKAHLPESYKQPAHVEPQPLGLLERAIEVIQLKKKSERGR